MATPPVVTDPEDGILKILRTFHEDDAGLVLAADRVEVLLERKGLLATQKVCPRNVGFHPGNRGGEGGNPLEVLTLASAIAEVGFSWVEVRHALCVAARPGDRWIEDFNARLAENSGIAPVVKDTILYGSLSASHLNAVLRCIAASVPSDCPFLAECGHMSLEKVRRRQPLFAEVVEHGLSWKVMSWEAACMYPEALDLICNARNVGSTMARAETEMQGLLRLHKLSAAAQAQNEEPPWKRIKITVRRSRPAYEASVDEMVAFVITKAGGVDGKFLTYMRAFHRNHVKSHERRHLPATLYGALAALPYQFLAVALFVAAWRSPTEAVVSGVCKGIGAAEVNALSRCKDDAARKRVETAEKALSLARTGLPCMGIDDPWDTTSLCKMFARLDIAMAWFVLDKQTGLKVQHSSAASVLQVFMNDLQAVYPKCPAAECHKQFCDAAAAEAAAAAKDASAEVADDASAEKNKAATAGAVAKAVNAFVAGQAAPPAAGQLLLYETTESGELIDPLARLRSQGLDIGSFVALTSEARAPVWQVASVGSAGGGEVLLARKNPEETKTVQIANFFADYAVRDAKDQFEEVRDWVTKRPKNTAAGKTLVKRGIVQAAISHLAEVCDNDVEEKVTLWTKPRKMATARIDCFIGAVVLLPETITVKTRERETSDDSALVSNNVEVEVGFSPNDDEHRYFALPGAAPLWYVTGTSDKEQVNMEWTTVRVQVLTAHFFEGAVRPVRHALPASVAQAPAPGADAVEVEAQASVRQAPGIGRDLFVRRGPGLGLKAPSTSEADEFWRDVEANADAGGAASAGAGAAAAGGRGRGKGAAAKRATAADNPPAGGAKAIKTTKAAKALAKAAVASTGAPVRRRVPTKTAEIPPSEPQPLKASVAPTDDEEDGADDLDEATAIQLDIPVLINTKPLKAGTPMAYFIEAKGPSKRPINPISVAMLAKKRIRF